MIECLEKLVDVVLHTLFRQVIWPALNGFVHVLLHELENKSQAAGWFVVENLDQLDDVRVRIQPLQCLDLAQVVDLVDAVEMRLHAFYGNVLPVAETLGFQHL